MGADVHLTLQLPLLVVVAVAVVLIILLSLFAWWTNRIRHQRQRLQRKNLLLQKAVLEHQGELNLLQFVSHQLRGPLQTLLTTLHNLKGTTDIQPAQTPYLERLENQIQSLTQLTENVLVMARLQTPGLALEHQRVNVREVVTHIIGLMWKKAAEKGIILSYRAPDNETIYAWANQALLEQLLLSLVDNSLKYTRPDSENVVISYKLFQDNVHVSVADDGMGIPAELQAELKKPGYRAPDALSAQRQGTGFGLSIAQQIVAQHGGELTIESQFGMGTIVTFTLPETPTTPTI